MAVTEVLLASRDRSLTDVVRASVESLSGCCLALQDGLDSLAARLAEEPPALCVIHVPDDADFVDVETHLCRADGDRRRALAVQTVVIIDSDRPELVLNLLRMGVVDCFSRPLDTQRFTMLVDMLTARHRLQRQDEQRQSESDLKHLGERTRFLFGNSDMQGLMHQVRRAATHDANVLLTGETGTGKTLLARVIHELSDRRDEPFVVVHCGALSESLVESELFGHCKGAYTSADKDRVGKLAAVGRGTLLLDDIDALPPAAQAKILRALEERVFEPVGSNRTQTVEARFIVASNRDLEAEIEAGRFRADLYYRLNVVQFHLLPLRDRKEEVPLIAQHFLAQSRDWTNSIRESFHPSVLQAFDNYDWPGNVRELRNVIERCTVLCQGRTIEWGDLPPAIQQALPTGQICQTPTAAESAPALGSSSLSALANARIQAEVNRIRQALEKHENNRKRAAEELGISRTALYKKLHRYGLMETA